MLSIPSSPSPENQLLGYPRRGALRPRLQWSLWAGSCPTCRRARGLARFLRIRVRCAPRLWVVRSSDSSRAPSRADEAERHEVRALSNRPLLRRDVRGRLQASSGRQGAGPAHRDDDGRRAAAPAAVGRARAPAHGDHVQRLRRQRRHGADLSLRSRPPDRGGRRMERDRAGPQTADPRAEPVHRRHLPRSENRQGRRHPRRDHQVGEQLQETVRRHEPARWRVVPHHGDGSRPRPRRADLRAGRQPALPVRRVVRPAEPRLDEAHVSAGVRVVADSSGRRLPQPAARHAGVDVRRRASSRRASSS